MRRLGNVLFTVAMGVMLMTAGNGLAAGDDGAKKPPVKKQREDPNKPVPVKPAPTFANVRYGLGERCVMDVWLAESDKPTPCVMHIHGGGWLQGDKTRLTLQGGPKALLKEGISLVSINYTFVQQTIIETGATRGTGAIQPRGDYPVAPVKAPLHDAARALQFIRYKAREWNIDPQRIGLTGGSAGACTSLWLDFHDDLADPASDDPVARQSTKPWCAAPCVPQTTLDPVQILEWIPNGTYGGHAFGYIWDRSDPTVEIRSFLADRESVKDWIAEYSPYALVTKDDPPVYLYYGSDIPEKGKEKKDVAHTANYGALLAEKLDQVGVEYEFLHGGVENPRFKNATEYLIWKLKQ